VAFRGAECTALIPSIMTALSRSFPAPLPQAPDWQLAADGAHRIGRELRVFAISAGRLPSFQISANYSRLRSLRRHTQTITAPPLRLPVTESVALPPVRGKHHDPISAPLRSSFHSLQLSAPACPKCKAQMMSLASSQHAPGASTCKRLNALSAIST